MKVSLSWLKDYVPIEMDPADLAEARGLLAERGASLCLTDMKLPDGNGISLVEHIQDHYPSMPVAMITAHGSVESAITALKAMPTRGAKSSLAKAGALSVSVAGLDFPNPVGVAAGFDKDAEVPDPLLGLGFGFTEAGSIPPLPAVPPP